MRLSLLSIPVAALALLSAGTRTESDPNANFERYRTYSWIDVPAGDPEWQARIQAQVDSRLAAKGWTKVEADGDAAVSAFAQQTEEDGFQTLCDGYPWLGWTGWAGSPGMTVLPDRMGNVVVDIFDAHSKRLVWRGMALQELSENPDKNEKQVERELGSIFQHFPPKPKD